MGEAGLDPQQFAHHEVSLSRALPHGASDLGAVVRDVGYLGIREVCDDFAGRVGERQCLPLRDLGARALDPGDEAFDRSRPVRHRSVDLHDSRLPAYTVVRRFRLACIMRLVRSVR